MFQSSIPGVDSDAIAQTVVFHCGLRLSTTLKLPLFLLVLLTAATYRHRKCISGLNRSRRGVPSVMAYRNIGKIHEDIVHKLSRLELAA